MILHNIFIDLNNNWSKEEIWWTEKKKKIIIINFLFQTNKIKLPQYINKSL